MNRAEALTLGPIRARAATRCHRGHPFDEANTYWAPRGSGQARKCRACHAENARRRRRGNVVEMCGAGTHPMTGENVGLHLKRGHRVPYCRACKNAKERVRRQALREARARELDRPELLDSRRGRTEDGRKVRWIAKGWLGDDGHAYMEVEAIEYERANDDSFRLAAVRNLKRWVVKQGLEMPEGRGWEQWGERRLDFATDLPITFSVRSSAPVVEVALAA